uniref:G-protein coupled receptors family 1 profile domain-containing protein n=1 Tax=Ciona intestinalis TaxID=7719 RepID=H2Y257_CIOIN
MLISPKQICDGIFDCFDLSDECLCGDQQACSSVMASKRNCTEGQVFTNNSGCVNPQYRVCDGVVSAIGFDEANCTNRHLCIEGASISISSSRVCDGVVDCDDGSDEIESLCRGSRFYCLNKDPISVPRTTVEDGIKDCSDGSDECPVNTTKSTIFSSQFEMIANPILSAIFWGMGVVSIFGNCLVIVTTIKRQVKAKTPSSTARINAWFITNLAMSDLLMGVYLLSISIQGAIFSGRYCYHDMEWRSGTLCSLMGATAVLATEASVFMMTIMTTHRLVSVMRPFALRNVELQPFAILHIGWALACVLAFTPLIKLPSGYFVLSVWYRNRFYKTDEVSKDLIFKLVDRVGNNTANNWLSAVEKLRATFELYEVKGEIGYYGETSVCMPRLFVNKGEATWEYSTSIIIMNFVLFIYIMVSYIVIYRKGTAMGTEKRAAANKKLQARIMRLVFTDFCCWMPICVMAFVSLSGIRIDKVVYAVTAGFLLPINSAVNPLIYTNVV